MKSTYVQLLLLIRHCVEYNQDEDATAQQQQQQ